MALTLTGLVARCMEPDALGAVVQSAETTPGRAFTRFFDARDFDAARARTSDTGPLDEVAAAALIDCVLQSGEPFGALEVGADADGFPARLLELVTRALQDETLARRLFDGGVLDRQGTGRHFLGSLPVRVIARQWTARSRADARAVLQGGWDEDLLNLLESAALRFRDHPEDLLVLVPTWGERAEAPSRVEATGRPSLLTWLEAAVEAQANELGLIIGARPVLEGARGASELEPVLDASDLEGVLSTVLDASGRERLDRAGRVVTAFTVEGLGRFRLTAFTERGRPSCTLRTHLIDPRFPVLGFPEEVSQALLEIGRGLVVIAAPPGQGRSTFFTALLREQALRREVVTLEEPLLHLGLGSRARQLGLDGDTDLEGFRVVASALPNAVVGVDVNDDDAGAELALELAARGHFVVLALRAVSSSSALHRLAALDVHRARRRLAESLSGVVTLRCFPSKGALVRNAELVVPTEGLRRHLRGNESPAPPVLLETEGPALDERLAVLLERGVLDAADARRWMVDARRASETIRERSGTESN